MKDGLLQIKFAIGLGNGLSLKIILFQYCSTDYKGIT